MRVLKHGKIYKRSFKKECYSCGCVFKYKLKDIKTGDMFPTIYCPECRARMSINLMGNEKI